MIGDSWGTTRAEMSERYACDDVVPAPTLAAWRAVTVEAPAAVVWSWLLQIRLAPYSYDVIDNLGRRSPRELLGLDDPEVGGPFTAVGGRAVGTVLAVEHGHQLTGRIMGVTMTYRVAALDPRRTRLVLKIVGEMPAPLARLLCLGDLVMARRQLLNLRSHAERTAAAERAGAKTPGDPLRSDRPQAPSGQ